MEQESIGEDSRVEMEIEMVIIMDCEDRGLTWNWGSRGVGMG